MAFRCSDSQAQSLNALCRADLTGEVGVEAALTTGIVA
jgi:hypothetical protein